MALVRFALFAEKAGAALADMETLAARKVDKDLPPDDRLNLIRARAEAEKLIPVFRSALYPEDEPVG